MAQKTKSARGTAKPAKGKAVKKGGDSLVSKISKTVTATLAAVTQPAKPAKQAKAATALKASRALKATAEPKQKQQIEKAKKALATAAKAPPGVPKAPPPAKAQHTMNPLNAKAQLSLKAEKKPETKSKRKIAMEISANEAASALAQKWATLYKKAEQIESKPYNMKGVFEEKTAIVHKVLGWGYILSNRNDRLEVLFKDGIKYLISNYKP